MMTKSNPADVATAGQPAWFELVRDRVSGLRFGVVQIVIHDGRVTQVESTERVRLPAQPASAVE